VLRCTEVDHGVLFVVRNRTTAGYRVVEGEPKTPAGTPSTRYLLRSYGVVRVLV
jgi:hypothetical protein